MAWDLNVSKKEFDKYARGRYWGVDDQNAMLRSLNPSYLAVGSDDLGMSDCDSNERQSSHYMLEKYLDVIKNLSPEQWHDDLSEIYLGLTPPGHDFPLASSSGVRGGAFICLDASFLYAIYVVYLMVVDVEFMVRGGRADSALCRKYTAEFPDFLDEKKVGGSFAKLRSGDFSEGAIRDVGETSDDRIKSSILEAVARAYQPYAEMWVLGHELGHRVLGRKKRARVARASSQKGWNLGDINARISTFRALSKGVQEVYSELTDDQKQEVDADIFALLLVSGFWKPGKGSAEGLTVAALGAVASLVAVGILDDWDGDDEHPSPSVRADVIIRCALRGLCPGETEGIPEVFNVSNKTKHEEFCLLLISPIVLMEWISGGHYSGTPPEKLLQKLNSVYEDLYQSIMSGGDAVVFVN